jgi:acyl-coenzyme A thioesterase PaaI-like protein
MRSSFRQFSRLSATAAAVASSSPFCLDATPLPTSTSPTTPITPFETRSATSAALSTSTASRPESDFTPIDLSRYALSHHLLHEALAGAEKLEKYELSLSADRQVLRAAVRLGSKACGHPRYIHGGAIASVFDDAMGTLFLSAGQGSGFTANLTVDYRAPIPAGAELRVTCAVERSEVSARSGARKVWLTSRMEAAEGAPPRLYAQARALFIVKDVNARFVVTEVIERLTMATKNALGGSGGTSKVVLQAVSAQPGTLDSMPSPPSKMKA